MGLFDKVASMVLGDKLGSYKPILDMIESQGGIQELISKFSKNGLSDIIQSWIGSGTNLPISVDQITKIFGSTFLQNIASSANTTTEETGSLITKFLPKLVDSATPDGQVPEKLDLTSIGMKLLKNKLLG